MTEEELRAMIERQINPEDRANYRRQVSESTVVILNHVARVVSLEDAALERRIELLEKCTEDAHVTLVGAIVLHFARREMARRGATNVRAVCQDELEARTRGQAEEPLDIPHHSEQGGDE